MISTLQRELSPRGRALARFRWAWERLGRYGRTVQPPPPKEATAERVLYGMAQPLLGFRLLFSNREMLLEGLVPAAWLAVFCGVCAFVSPARPDEVPLWRGRLETFYRTFAVLAPVPSVLFARHYARLAAQVRWRLGFGPCGPRELPLLVSLKRAIQQSIVVGIGLLPLIALWNVLPVVGTLISQALLGAWAVHWVVVDAFDDARVVLPGETVRSAEEADRRAPSPWFVRGFRRLANWIHLPVISGLLRVFASLVDRLALPWRGELALMEANPKLAAGFAITTASLLATPGLNLLFRPIILVASSHLVGHLEAQDPAQHPELPPKRVVPALPRR